MFVAEQHMQGTACDVQQAPEHAYIPCVTALLVLLSKVLAHHHYLADLMFQGSSGRTVCNAHSGQASKLAYAC